MICYNFSVRGIAMQMEREKRLPVNRQNVDQMAHMLAADTGLRTVVVTVPGMGFNLIYAVFNGVIGVMNHSAWHA